MLPLKQRVDEHICEQLASYKRLTAKGVIFDKTSYEDLKDYLGYLRPIMFRQRPIIATRMKDQQKRYFWTRSCASGNCNDCTWGTCGCPCHRRGKPRVFIYAMAHLNRKYEFYTPNPWVWRSQVFMGACKKRIACIIREGDWLVGISPAKCGKIRRIMFVLELAEKITFAEAFEQGNKDVNFRSVRGRAIHFRLKPGENYRPGDPTCCEHLSNVKWKWRDAPHKVIGARWEMDMMPASRDAFLVGSKRSWVSEGFDSPQIPKSLVALIRQVLHWKSEKPVSQRHPLTEAAFGKHVMLEKDLAQQAVKILLDLEGK